MFKSLLRCLRIRDAPMLFPSRRCTSVPRPRPAGTSSPVALPPPAMRNNETYMQFQKVSGWSSSGSAPIVCAALCFFSLLPLDRQQLACQGSYQQQSMTRLSCWCHPAHFFRAPNLIHLKFRHFFHGLMKTQTQMVSFFCSFSYAITMRPSMISNYVTITDQSKLSLG